MNKAPVAHTAASNLLWNVVYMLDKYANYVEGMGKDRSAIDDLVTFRRLLDTYVDYEEHHERKARDVMAVLIEKDIKPSLAGTDPHFVEAVWQGHADEVREALEELGIYPEEETLEEHDVLDDQGDRAH